MHRKSCLKKVWKTYESDEPRINTAIKVLMAPFQTATPMSSSVETMRSFGEPRFSR